MKKSLFSIIISLFLIGSAKPQSHPITIHSNQRVISLQMTASEYNSWKNNDEFSVDVKRQALIQDIFQKFEDKFDFIFLILNETTIPANFPYNGKCFGTSNATSGLGISNFNSDALYCSAGKLKAVIALAQKDYLMYGPSLHEIMHNWGNQIINSVDWNGTSEINAIPHWGFTGGSTAGQLGGFKQSTLQTNIGGNPNKYRTALFGGFANGGNSVPYDDLELYLMGMIPLTDVANFDVFSGITQKATIGTDITEFTASKRVNYDNAKVLANAGGPRNPSYTTSQKNFRLLVVLLTPTPLTNTEWTTIDAQSEWFGRPSSGGHNGIFNFWEATRGLGTMETDNLLNAVRISQISPPTITATGSTTFCNGRSLTLSTTSTETLQWYKDGNPLEGATSQTYIATQSGSYSLKAGVGNCSVESLSPILVTVTSDIPIPLITASGPATFCQGGSVRLTSSSAGSYSYLWNNGSTSQSVLVNSSGNYSVKLTDNNGCTSFSSASFPVLAGNLGTWTQKSNFGGTARYGAVGFLIGSKIYLLTGYYGSYSKDFWEYDPSSDKWTQKTSFGGTARIDAIGFTIGSKGYIGLGYDGSYKKDLWEYDPSTNSWTQKADFLGVARYGAVSFTIGSKGYVGTGNSGTLLRDFWEYDPASNLWTQKTSFGGTARHSAVGFSIGTKGYVGTGVDGSYTNDFWEYDPISDSWLRRADFGGSARFEAVGFSIGTKGYLGTGYNGSYKNDLWEYDPTRNIWTQKADFGGTARDKAVGLSSDKAGFIGTGANGYYQQDFWEYKINTPSITANGPTTFCKGANVVLTSSPATSYVWSNNSSSQSIVVSTGGDYSVTTNDGSGCLSSSSITTVTTKELPANAGSITGMTNVCQGQNSVTYAISSLTNATSYAWTLPSGATGTSTTNSINVSYGLSAVSGSISVKGSNDCGDGALSTLSISVNNKPNKPLISQTGNVLHSDASFGNQWYNQSGLLGGATNHEYTISANGDYYVIVTILGCNSDASNIYNAVLTGIEKVENNKTIKVYPNPVSDELIIEIKNYYEKVNYEILNSMGQVVCKGIILDKTIVQTTNFMKGVYLIKFEKGTTIKFKKIVKG